jgi:hypothetical protein
LAGNGGAGASGGGAGQAGSAGQGGTTGAAGSGGQSAFWERIGPWNFFNEVNGNGPSGTCAEAIADPSQPATMYQGGQNNSATPGVRKSTDGGKHWDYAVNGLLDHSIRALRLDPAVPATVYAGTPSGVFRSTDGAATWTFEAATQSYGDVRRLVATTVAGTPTLLAATGTAIGYRAFANGAWARSAAPSGGVYDLVIASAPSAGPTVAFAALDNGRIYKVSLASTGVTWTSTAMSGNTLTVDPSNPNHVVATVHPGSGPGGDYTIIESTDGGTTVQSLDGSANVFYVAFDPRDATGMTLWTGSEGGVGRSTDGGKTFAGQPWNIKSKDGYNTNNAQIDVQRILVDFPGQPAFCSDQGLVQYDPSSKGLVSLNGDIRNAIVTSVAASRLDPGTVHVLTTMWDWGPTESWDGGSSWQATTWYGSAYWNSVGGKGAPSMGEGGQVFALANAGDGKAHVVMHDGAQTVFYSSDGGLTFASAALSQTAAYDAFDYARDTSGQANGTVYLGTTSSTVLRSTNFGQTWATWGPNRSVSAIAADPKDPNHVFIASGSCLVSTADGGTTWSSCVTPSPRGASIRRLGIRPDDPTKLLALTTGGEILRSTNSGANWTAVSSGGVLTSGNANAALMSYAPSGSLAVMVATTTSRPVVTPHVMSSSDDGTTWTDITYDMVATQLNNLTWDGGDLYIGSSGEAILRRKGLAP